jgi:hypothetical protein
MFKNIINTNYLEDIFNIARTGIILEDRQKYIKIFDETRSIIKNNDIVILSNFNEILKKGIIDNPIQLEDSMKIYTTHPRKITTFITNHLHKKFGKYVMMKSNIPNISYEIIYDMRSLIKIFYINRYKNINIPKLFNTIKIDNINYFPEYIELIEIYHKLYLPNYYEDWSSLALTEKLLYDQFTKSITGGSHDKKNKILVCKKNRNINVGNIKLLLLNFIESSNYIILGELANKLINSTNLTSADFDLTDSSNIQIISENPIEQDYSNIVNYLSRYTPYGITYKKQKLYIPNDNRIYKHTFYIKCQTLTSNTFIGSSGIDKPFLDIYNCGEYEIIPYLEKKYDKISLRIGNTFVQLRFLLIDFWLYNILYNHIKIIDTNIYIKKVNYITTTMKSIKKLLPIESKNKYMGINFDEKIEQKIVISEKNIYKNIYYPELNFTKYKKYKLIATSS